MSDAAGRAAVLAAKIGRLFCPAIDAGRVGVATVGATPTSAGASAPARPTSPSAAELGATREVGTASNGAALGCVEAAATRACTLPSRRTNTSPAPSKTAAVTARNKNTPLARVGTPTRDVSSDLGLIGEVRKQGPFLWNLQWKWRRNWPVVKKPTERRSPPPMAKSFRCSSQG
jgi:hypothetical protein